MHIHTNTHTQSPSKTHRGMCACVVFLDLLIIEISEIIIPFVLFHLNAHTHTLKISELVNVLFFISEKSMCIHLNSECNSNPRFDYRKESAMSPFFLSNFHERQIHRHMRRETHT